MPKATISATLLPATVKLGPAPTTTVTLQFANDLVQALNATTFSYKASDTNSKQYELYNAVLHEIELLLNDPDDIHMWWPEVNQSKPVGNIWEYDPGLIYVHPRRGGGVIAVDDGGGMYRYLSISTPA